MASAKQFVAAAYPNHLNDVSKPFAAAAYPHHLNDINKQLVAVAYPHHLNDINKTSCSTTYQTKMQKYVQQHTRELKSAGRYQKYKTFITQNQTKIQDNTAEDNSMTLVNSPVNSIRSSAK